MIHRNFFLEDAKHYIDQFYNEASQTVGSGIEYNFSIEKCPLYTDFLNRDDSFKTQLMIYCTAVIVGKDDEYLIGNWQKTEFIVKFEHLLFKSDINIKEEDLIYIIQYLFDKLDRNGYSNYHYKFPYLYFYNLIDNFVQKNGLSDALKEKLALLIRTTYVTKDDLKLNNRLEKILYAFDYGDSFDLTLYINVRDEVGQAISLFFKKHHKTEYFQDLVLLLLDEAFDKSTPAKKWQIQAEKLLAKIDKKELIDFMNQVSDITIEHLEKCHKIKQLWNYNFEYYSQNGYFKIDRWFAAKNEAFVKRLIWLVPFFDKNDDLIEKISALGFLSYKKYAGIGHLLGQVGSACLYVFSSLPNQKGIPYLTKFNQKISNKTIKKTIEKHLQEVALKSGKTPYEIEEEAISTFGFDDSNNTVSHFGNFKAVTTIVSNTKIQTIWYNENGKSFKSVPNEVKTQFVSELKSFNLKSKQIQELLVNQAKRFEDIYLQKREWKYSNWADVYNKVGVLTYLAHKIIWEFDINGVKEEAIFQNGQFINIHGHPLSISPENTIVRLWHPVTSTIEKVSQWRDFIFKNSIVQPFKQAFREIYIITDAELNTQIYSNRFAAHILKNYQFGALCKNREWQGYNQFHDGGTPTRLLKEYNLYAQFWVSFTNTIDYITTDQVCFFNNTGRLDLLQVPPIVLSEMMRDVDMFVAVCSVGSDANWRDNGGNHQYNTYWESYSFGTLNETAKVRKSILEKILPKLKIAKVAHLEDKFLVVKGTFRSYKIHLGSTNILMTPNDQYLCIVPDRSKPKDENVYLPFEGDAGLSVIISKAFLLANDDKITDSTITSQIRRK